MGKGIRCNEHCPHLTPDGLMSRMMQSRGVKLNQLVNLCIGQIQLHDVDNK